MAAVMAPVMFDHKVTVANAGHQHPGMKAVDLRFAVVQLVREGDALRPGDEADPERDAERHAPIGTQVAIRTRCKLLTSRRRDSPD